MEKSCSDNPSSAPAGAAPIKSARWLEAQRRRSEVDALDWWHHRYFGFNKGFQRRWQYDHFVFGARPMERTIEQLIAQPLAKAMIEGRLKGGGSLIAKISDGGITFSPLA